MDDKLVEAGATALYMADPEGDYKLEGLPWDPDRAGVADHYRNLFRAAVGAIEAQGFAIVPVEPSGKMVIAGMKAIQISREAPLNCRLVQAWNAMLAAAKEE